jgi:hypothetical protein
MKYLSAFVHFWYDFVVGDDWRVAAGVIVTLAATAALAAAGLPAWWLLPVAALAFLTVSLLQATRKMR